MRELSEYESDVISSLAEVRDCREVTVAYEHVGDLIEEDVDFSIFDLFDEFRGVTLSPRLVKFNVRITGLACHWWHGWDGEALGGEFSIRDVFESLILPSPNIPDLEDCPVKPSRLRVIDFMPRSGADAFAAIRLSESTDPLELWYSEKSLSFTDDASSGFVKMDVDYRDYLDALAITKGVFGWQLLFVDVSLSDSLFRHHLSRINRMLEVFPKLFPNHDYSDLRARLEARL